MSTVYNDIRIILDKQKKEHDSVCRALLIAVGTLEDVTGVEYDVEMCKHSMKAIKELVGLKYEL